MATEETFLWKGNISTYQCDWIHVKSNTLTSNLDGINLRSLLLNGWRSCIDIFTSQYLLPINYNTLAYNFGGLNPIFIFEFIEFPYLHVHITRSSTCIYTSILQMTCNVIYYFMSIGINISTSIVLNLKTHICCMY